MTETAHRPLECWLPALQRFDARHPLRILLQRAHRLVDGPTGYLDGLAAYFQCDGQIPAAALIREHLLGDAGDTCWLSADPAWIQPDLSGARLMACGQLQLSRDEAQALAKPLQPVFDDAGMVLEVSSPDRWHLRLPAQSSLPDFVAPEQALGEDLYGHLPQGADGRRWRMLFNEVQVLLHQHDVNVERRARGLPPVNSLWFWGGGVLSHRVTTTLDGVIGEDVLLVALAQRAGILVQERNDASLQTARAGWLIDLQDQSPDVIAVNGWPALQALSKRQPLLLAFASGERWLHRPWHRLRIWRQGAR